MVDEFNCGMESGDAAKNNIATEKTPTTANKKKKCGCFTRLRRSKWWKRFSYLTVALSLLLMVSSYAASIYYTFQGVEDLFTRSNYFALDIFNYPAVVLCNSNQIRKSYIAELVTGDVLNLLQNFPHSWDHFADKLTHLDKLNSTEFFTGAAQLKKNFIVGCKQPNGANCSYSDFDQTITDFGTCYALKVVLPETPSFSDAIPTYDSPLEITVNLEAYDKLVKFDEPSSLKVAFLQPDGDSLIDETALDVTPGSFAQIALIYTEVSRNQDACQCNSTSKTNFYSKYTRHACKTEKHSQSIVSACGCKSYNSHNKLEAPVCNVSKHLGCTLRKKKKKDLITIDDCPNSCQSQHFEADLTISQLSTEQANDSLNLGSLLKLFGSFIDIVKPGKTNERSSEMASLCRVFVANYQEWQNLSFYPDHNESCLNDFGFGPLTYQSTVTVLMQQQQILSILNAMADNNSINNNFLANILLSSVEAIQLQLSSDSWLINKETSVNSTISCAKDIAENLTVNSWNESAVYDCIQEVETDLKALETAANYHKSYHHHMLQIQEDLLSLEDYSHLSTSNLLNNAQMHNLNDKCLTVLNMSKSDSFGNSTELLSQIFQSLLEVNMEELLSHKSQLRFRLTSLSNQTRGFNATTTCIEDTITRLSNFTETLNSTGQNLLNSAMKIQLFNVDSKNNSDCSSVEKQTEDLVKNNLVKLQIYFKQEPNPAEFTGCCTATGNQTAKNNITRGRNKPTKSQGKKCGSKGNNEGAADLAKVISCAAGILAVTMWIVITRQRKPYDPDDHGIHFYTRILKEIELIIQTSHVWKDELLLMLNRLIPKPKVKKGQTQTDPDPDPIVLPDPHPHPPSPKPLDEIIEIIFIRFDQKKDVKTVDTETDTLPPNWKVYQSAFRKRRKPHKRIQVNLCCSNPPPTPTISVSKSNPEIYSHHSDSDDTDEPLPTPIPTPPDPRNLRRWTGCVGKYHGPCKGRYVQALLERKRRRST